MIKKLIYILILFIISSVSAFAQTEEGYLDYSGFPYNYKPQEAGAFLNQANKNIDLFEKAKNSQDKSFYLNEAMRYYFMLEKSTPSSIESKIGLGRVYDAMEKDSFAKKYFFTAINFDMNNPKTNFYFANFYFKRSDFLLALYYYQKAYENGYSNKYELSFNIGTIYEKLGDILNAEKYYKHALSLNPSNQELSDKLTQLESLNYSDSQYYLFNKQNKNKK